VTARLKKREENAILDSSPIWISCHPKLVSNGDQTVLQFYKTSILQSGTSKYIQTRGKNGASIGEKQSGLNLGLGQSCPSPLACFNPPLCRSQPHDLDRLQLATHPCASLHVTFKSTSPPLTTSAVTGVPRGCTPGLKSPKIQWIPLI
jgi:hypothetical protein